MNYMDPELLKYINNMRTKIREMPLQGLFLGYFPEPDKHLPTSELPHPNSSIFKENLSHTYMRNTLA